MDDIKIVKYQKSDYPRFSEFAKKSFHAKYILGDEKFLDWQYSRTGVLFLAKRDEEIIGFFGYKDFPYKVYGETKIVRAVMNLFVDEKYRMAGVGPKLAGAVLGEGGYILVSSYNEAAQKLYRHFRKNWTEAGDLERFFAALSPHKLMEGFHIPHLSPPPFTKEGGKLNIEKITKVSGEFDEFRHKVRAGYPITIERSSEYLKWRYLTHPFFDYQFLAARRDGKLSGFLIYRFEEVEDFKIARIIDFVAHESVEVSLLREFLERAKNSGAQAADFMFSGLLYKESLKAAGFFDVFGTDFAKFPIRSNPLSYSKFVISSR